MSFQQMRPGIYSDYTVTARYSTPRSVQAAGLVCQASHSLREKVHIITTPQQADEVFGTQLLNAQALQCTLLLLESGVSKVCFSSMYSDYATALALLEDVEHIGALVCDATQLEDCKTALQSVERSATNRRERLLFLAEDQMSPALLKADQLNHPRCVITLGNACYEQEDSPLFLATALAGALLSANNPLQNLNGLALPLLTSLSSYYSEEDIQKALARGITPFEVIGEQVECIRGVTTCTQQNGVTDYSRRSVNTTLIIDDVMQTLRLALKAKIQGGLVAVSLDSVASQVMVELEDKKKLGILADYQPPRVYHAPDDPEVCIVELAFRVAHVISQIHIRAHIQL